MARSNIISVKFLADVAQMRAGIDQVNGKLSAFSKAAKVVGAATAVYFSAKPIIEFASASVQAASDYEEAFNKANVVFGDSALQVKNFTDDAVTGFGLTRAAALEFSGTFGNLLTSFGVGQREAADMSTTLVQLAADLASFNNTSVEDALNALRSGLSGETEPLKRFGVVLQDTRLRAEALALGLGETTGALDPLTKSQAAYSLILKDTTNAQGDFARTSDGLANTTRILQAAVEDAKATIGEGLVRAIERFSEAAGGPQGAAEIIDHMAERLGLFVDGVAIAATQMGGLNIEVDKSNRILDVATDNYDRAGGGLFGYADAVVAAQASGENMIQALMTGFSAISESDRRTRDNAEAQRLLEAGYRAAAGAAATAATNSYGLSAAYDTAAAAARNFLDTTGNRVLYNTVFAQVRNMNKTVEKTEETFTRTGGAASKATEEIKKLKDASFDLGDVLIDVDVKAKKANASLVDAYKDKLKDLENAAKAYKEAVANAIAETQKQVDDYRGSLNETFLGVDLDDFVTTQADGTTIFDSAAFQQWLGDKEEIRKALSPMLGQIPQVWAEQILGMGNDAALATLNWITNSADEVSELQRNMDTLAINTENTLTGPMSEAMRSTFWEAQQEGIDAAKQKVKEEAKEFKKWVRSKLKTKITIDVEYREINSPPAAASSGGAVRQVQQFEALNGRSWRV